MADGQTPASFVPDTQDTGAPKSFVADEQASRQPPQKSLLSRAWDWATTGLIPTEAMGTTIANLPNLLSPTSFDPLAVEKLQAARDAAISKGQPVRAALAQMAGGTAESAGHLVSGFTSPVALASAGLGAGSRLAAESGTAVRTLLAIPQVASSLGFAARGVSDIASGQPGETTADRLERILTGGADIASGLAGAAEPIQMGARGAGEGARTLDKKALGVEESLTDVVAQRKAVTSDLQTQAGNVYGFQSKALKSQIQHIEDSIPDPVRTKGQLQELINNAVAEKGVRPEQVPSKVYSSVGKPGGTGVEAPAGSALEGVLSNISPNQLAKLPPDLQSVLTGGASDNLTFAQLRDVYSDLYRSAQSGAIPGDLRAGLMEARNQLGETLKDVADQHGFGKEYREWLPAYNQHMNQMGSDLVQKFIGSRNTAQKIALLNNARTGPQLREILQTNGVDFSQYENAVSKGLLQSRLKGISDEAAAVTRGEYGPEGLKSLKLQQVAEKVAPKAADIVGPLAAPIIAAMGHPLWSTALVAWPVARHIAARVLSSPAVIRTLTRRP